MTDEQQTSDDSIYNAGPITPSVARGAEIPGSRAADDAFYGRSDDDRYPNLQDADDGDIIDPGDAGDSDALYETPVEDLVDADFEDFVDDDDDADLDTDLDTDDDEELTSAQLAEDEQRRLARLQPQSFAERLNDFDQGRSHAENRAVRRVAKLMAQSDAADREGRDRVPLSREEAGKFAEARQDLETQGQLIAAGKMTEAQAVLQGLSQHEYDDIVEQLRPKSKAEAIIQELERKFDSTTQRWGGTDAELAHLTATRKRLATARLSKHPFFNE